MARRDPLLNASFPGAFSGIFPDEEEEATPVVEVREKRSRKRLEVQVAGRYRARHGSSKDIWIQNITQSGCSFLDKFSMLPVGGSIMFRIGSIGPFNATVRWCDESTVGVEFDHPLHPSVLDHIMKTMNID